jgi:hypothetical protein
LRVQYAVITTQSCLFSCLRYPVETRPELFAPDEIVPDKPFSVKYCPALDSGYPQPITESINIILAVSSKQGSFDDAIVIARRKSDEGYEFDTQLPLYPDAPLDSKFLVVEVTNEFPGVRLYTFLKGMADIV